MNTIEWTALIGAWTGVLTIVGAIFSFAYTKWSRKQDKAINKLQVSIIVLAKNGNELRTYIRKLLLLLKKNNIEYPEPPNSFYNPNFDVQVREEMIKNGQ